MAGQITKLRSGNHQPVGDAWAGTKPKKEDEDDNIEENGTDYRPVKKSYRLYKSLIQDEAILKALDDEEEEEDKDDDHEDEKDDRQLFGKMMEDAGDDAKVRKSFFEHVEDNETLVKGLESSPFLYEMVKSIGYSFLNLEDRIGTQLFQMDQHHDQFAKSIDGVFENMGKSLGLINDTADQVGVQKSQETDGNVGVLEKGNFGSDGEGFSRDQVLNALIKGVEAGQISATEVVKFETTGAVSPHIQKSLGL